MNRVRSAAFGLVSTILVSACSVAGAVAPTCDTESALVLLSQAVPSASHIPCLRRLPEGWSVGAIDIDSERGRFWLDSDRGGEDAVIAVLDDSCAPIGEVTEEVDGVTRYVEEITAPRSYRGTWSEVFDGGCVTYEVHLRAETWRTLAEEIDAALVLVAKPV